MSKKSEKIYRAGIQYPSADAHGDELACLLRPRLFFARERPILVQEITIGDSGDKRDGIKDDYPSAGFDARQKYQTIEYREVDKRVNGPDSDELGNLNGESLDVERVFIRIHIFPKKGWSRYLPGLSESERSSET